MSEGLSGRDVERASVVQAGAVHIVLSRDLGARGSAQVHNGRIAGVLPALAGRPADGLAQAMARLFPVCGLAHEIVVCRALEAAAGERPDADRESSRERCLLAESAVTQIWRALVDWPRALGAADVDLSLLANARRVFGRAWSDGELLDRQALELADNLSCVLFAGAEDCPPNTADALIGYLRDAETPGARLVRAATSVQAALSPQAMPVLLGRPAAAWFAKEMLATPEFGVSPRLDGRPAECGALSRLAAAEQERLWREGPLAGRLLAMLLQGSRTIASLREAGAGGVAAPRAESVAAPSERGWGVGVAETARGPLACLLRVSVSRSGAPCVEEIRLCAPSEWCLHPAGAMVRLLGELSGDALEWSARVAIAAFDPCADVVVDVRGAREQGAQAGECQ